MLPGCEMFRVHKHSGGDLLRRGAYGQLVEDKGREVRLRVRSRRPIRVTEYDAIEDDNLLLLRLTQDYKLIRLKKQRQRFGMRTVHWRPLAIESALRVAPFAELYQRIRGTTAATAP